MIRRATMENIRPSAELRNKYKEISDFCRDTREPVYITVNGRGDTVILNIEEYNLMIKKMELLQMIVDAEADVKSGRTMPADDVMQSLKQKYNFK